MIYAGARAAEFCLISGRQIRIDLALNPVVLVKLPVRAVVNLIGYGAMGCLALLGRAGG